MGRQEGGGIRGAAPSPVSRRREKIPSGSQGDRCVLRLASRAQAQSGARNARGQAQARTRTLRAKQGSGAGGPAERNGCERRDPCRRRKAGKAGRKPRRPCAWPRARGRNQAREPRRRVTRAAGRRRAHARYARKGVPALASWRNETAANGGTHAEDAKPGKPGGTPGAPARNDDFMPERDTAYAPLAYKT